jgi:cytochrome bd-type quinol oxidase subunit 2
MILHQLIEFDTLRIIWWALLGELLTGFALTDGVGQLFITPDFVRHAGVHRDIHAARSVVHRLGLQSTLGQGD